MRAVHVAALVAAFSLASCGGSPVVHTIARHRLALAPPHAAQITIDSPVEGTRTAHRSIVLTGRVPTHPRGGGTELIAKVNRRPVRVFVDGGRYRLPVALEPGRNDIALRAEVTDATDKTLAKTAVTEIAVTRRPTPGPPAARLDLATAYLVTDSSDEVYWLCGEGDGCGWDVRCFRVSHARVDCPVGQFYDYNLTRMCGVVISIILVGDRVYFGHYPCQGRLTPHPERFVQAGLQVAMARYVVDLDEGEGYVRAEVNRPNRYGAPRFDIVHDVLLP